MIPEGHIVGTWLVDISRPAPGGKQERICGEGNLYMTQELRDLATETGAEDIFSTDGASVTASLQLSQKEFGSGTTRFASVTLRVVQDDALIRLGLAIADRLVRDHLEAAESDE